MHCYQMGLEKKKEKNLLVNIASKLLLTEESPTKYSSLRLCFKLYKSPSDLINSSSTGFFVRVLMPRLASAAKLI